MTNSELCKAWDEYAQTKGQTRAEILAEHLTEEVYSYDDYEEYLDENNPLIEIEGIEYYPSYVFKHLDEVAYDDGYSNWIDGKLASCEIMEAEDSVYYNYDDAEALLDELLNAEEEEEAINE